MKTNEIAMKLDDRSQKKINVIIPIYNEEQVVEQFFAKLRDTLEPLPYHFSITFVDDGSTDSTHQILTKIADADQRVVVVQLSRNFGHQAALTAGLDISSADAVITMDSDGQHPPELIGQMLELHESGYDIVLTQRLSNTERTWFKRIGTAAFYKINNIIGDTKIEPGAADFRLLSKNVVEGIREFREYHRILRGIVSWMGFRTIIIPFEARERLAGDSKYTTRKMFRLARDAIFSFSLTPLHIGLSLGFLFLAMAAGEMIVVLSVWLRGRQELLVPGWGSLMFVLLFLGGILLLFLGIMGIYLGYIFQEVKRRPLYLIRDIERHASEDTNSNPERA
ncbi:MAG: glycosyltransferase family 2 protein [Anaerolineales bacterium]